MQNIELDLEEIGGIDVLVTSMIAIMVLSAIILAVWNPATGDGLRKYLYDFINDSYFVATFGSGIRDGLSKLLDLVPLIAFLTMIGALFVMLKSIATNPAQALGF